MKLVTFRHEGRVSFGVVEGGAIVDLAPKFPGVLHLRALLAALGSDLVRRVKAALPAAPRIDASSVTLLAPIPNPSKYLALGGNYRAHRAESASAAQADKFGQIWFNKQVTCVVGPNSAILHPAITSQLDYEGELGIVIGVRCRNVSAANARSVIAGYLVCNDVSMRDWQAKAPTHTLGKSHDTHGPIGPWLVTADEIGDPHALSLETRVNGEIRQNASTADMVARVEDIIAELSAACTLEPGDILATGTPAGVGKGFDPPRFLRVGDVVSVTIERLGTLENRVADDTSPTVSPLPVYS